MSKRGAVYWASRTWVAKFNLLDSTRPAVVLDFVNQKYFDGTNSNASLASMVSGSVTLDANGLLCNNININGIGALLAALQTSAVTVRAETYQGNGTGPSGIVGIQSPYVPLFVYLNNVTTYNNADIHSLPSRNWTGINFSVAAWDSAGRDVIANSGAIASDTGTMVPATSVALGSFWGANVFGGYMRTLAVYPVRAPLNTLIALTGPPPFQASSETLTPLSGSHAVLINGNSDYITPGPKLIYERTQPWTCIAAINRIRLPNTAAVIFTNVINAPWFGYEIWVDPNGLLRVRIMGNWNGTVGSASGMCAVIGSINVVDGHWHTIAASYDGSSTPAGIKFYVDGVLDTGVTIEQNNLSTTIVNGTPDFWVGNQLNSSFQIGALDNFTMSNVVRSGAYIAANVGVMPVVDGNTVLSYAFEEGTGTTTADSSANNFTATLKNGTAWV